jgi:hypothetical protein
MLNALGNLFRLRPFQPKIALESLDGALFTPTSRVSYSMYYFLFPWIYRTRIIHRRLLFCSSITYTFIRWSQLVSFKQRLSHVRRRASLLVVLVVLVVLVNDRIIKIEINGAFGIKLEFNSRINRKLLSLINVQHRANLHIYPLARSLNIIQSNEHYEILLFSRLGALKHHHNGH